MKIADLFAETNEQYPIIDMDTPGLTTDILDIEDAEPVVCQYKPELSMPESEKYDKESFDKLLPAHVFMPRGDGWEHDTVIGRKCDQDGHLVGHGSANLLLYTKAYEGEFQVLHFSDVKQSQSLLIRHRSAKKPRVAGGDPS